MRQLEDNYKDINQEAKKIKSGYFTRSNIEKSINAIKYQHTIMIKNLT